MTARQKFSQANRNATTALCRYRNKPSNKRWRTLMYWERQLDRLAEKVVRRKQHLFRKAGLL